MVQDLHALLVRKTVEKPSLKIRSVPRRCQGLLSEIKILGGLVVKITAARKSVAWEDQVIWKLAMFPKGGPPAVEGAFTQEQMRAVVNKVLSVNNARVWKPDNQRVFRLGVAEPTMRDSNAI